MKFKTYEKGDEAFMAPIYCVTQDTKKAACVWGHIQINLETIARIKVAVEKNQKDGTPYTELGILGAPFEATVGYRMQDLVVTREEKLAIIAVRGKKTEQTVTEVKIVDADGDDFAGLFCCYADQYEALLKSDLPIVGGENDPKKAQRYPWNTVVVDVNFGDGADPARLAQMNTLLATMIPLDELFRSPSIPKLQNDTQYVIQAPMRKGGKNLFKIVAVFKDDVTAQEKINFATRVAPFLTKCFAEANEESGFGLTLKNVECVMETVKPKEKA